MQTQPTYLIADIADLENTTNVRLSPETNSPAFYEYFLLILIVSAVLPRSEINKLFNEKVYLWVKHYEMNTVCL